MSVVGTAARRNETGGLTATTAAPTARMAGDALPLREGYIRRRSPQIVGDRPLFAIKMISVEGGGTIKVPTRRRQNK